MPMTRDEHDALLTELLTEDLQVSRKTEILQLLRVDNTDFHQEHNKMVETNKKLQGDNDDLVISNSKLFRQLRTDDTGNNVTETKKEFSETVTLEQFEKGV